MQEKLENRKLSNCVDPFLHTDLNNFLLKRKMGKCARRIHHLNPFSPFVSKVGHPSLCITQILHYTDITNKNFTSTRIQKIVGFVWKSEIISKRLSTVELGNKELSGRPKIVP